MTIITDFLENSVERFPEKIALSTTEKKYSFKELFNLVDRFSNGITKFPKNSVVTLMFENSAEFVISYLGTLRGGCIAHLISPNISNSNFTDQIRSARPKAIVTSEDIIDKIKNWESSNAGKLEFSNISDTGEYDKNRKPDCNDIAYLIYTSGTTSKPKGVPITHLNAVFTTQNIVNTLNYSESDIDLLPLPLFHSFGLGCMHTSMYVGSTLILQKNTNDISKTLEAIKKYNSTTFAAVPATLTKMAHEFPNKLTEYLSELRLIITNSTPIAPNIVKIFKNNLKKGRLATYYGLTEASRSTFMIFEDDDQKYSSVGLPATGVEIKLLDDSEKNSKRGTIWIKGNNTIKKYWNNDDTDRNIKDNWLRTGDVGYFDDDGFLYITGRIDNIINVGGEKVIPEEVENVVKTLSGIEEAIVIGIKHDIFGQVVKLLIKKSKGATIEKSDILSHCIKNLERYKIPTVIEFVDEFPTTDYGKVKRFMLQ